MPRREKRGEGQERIKGTQTKRQRETCRKTDKERGRSSKGRKEKEKREKRNIQKER